MLRLRYLSPSYIMIYLMFRKHIFKIANGTENDFFKVINLNGSNILMFFPKVGVGSFIFIDFR